MIAAIAAWRHTDRNRGEVTEWERTVQLAAVPIAGDFLVIPRGGAVAGDMSRVITEVTYHDGGHVQLRLRGQDIGTTSEYDQWVAWLHAGGWRRILL